MRLALATGTCTCADLHPCVKSPLPVHYKGEILDEEAYRIDLLVEECLVVELKTVPALLPIHEAQTPSPTCSLSNKCLGLLINFQRPLLADGIKRHRHQLSLNNLRVSLCELRALRFASHP